MKKLCVICRDNSYLNQFTDTIPKYLPRDWSVAGYETIEEYERYEMTGIIPTKESGAGTEGRDARLTGVILAQVKEEEREAVRSRHTGSNMAILWLTEREERSGEEVFMFRPAPVIATRVTQSLNEEPLETPQENRGFRVIGYVGAEGGAGCTTEAYRQAVALSMKRETSFLCLDQAPGIRELSAFRSGVSELVYLLREYGPAWGKQFENCAGQVGALTVFAGVEHLGDATMLGDTEVEDFLSGMKEMDYGNVVIDFGTNGSEVLLSRCDVIYFCGGRNEEKRKILEIQAANGGFRNRLHPVESLSEVE